MTGPAGVDGAAERHRRVAARFSGLVDGVTDWDAPTPVREWAVRDVVVHLVEWLPGLLSGGGVTLPSGPSPEADPRAAWHAHSDSVQALLDDPETATRPFTNPNFGTLPLADAIDRFYTNDVFVHAWDLARGSGQDATLDPAACARMVAEMEPLDEMLRSSGQFGPRVPVSDDAPAQDRLIGFLGRDPYWSPDGRDPDRSPDEEVSGT